ncbi:MAG: hypothetical protein AAFR87_27295, partial [Bacteroidota bacterium]
ISILLESSTTMSKEKFWVEIGKTARLRINRSWKSKIGLEEIYLETTFRIPFTPLFLRVLLKYQRGPLWQIL